MNWEFYLFKHKDFRDAGIKLKNKRWRGDERAWERHTARACPGDERGAQHPREGRC